MKHDVITDCSKVVELSDSNNKAEGERKPQITTKKWKSFLCPSLSTKRTTRNKHSDRKVIGDDFSHISSKKKQKYYSSSFPGRSISKKNEDNLCREGKRKKKQLTTKCNPLPHSNKEVFEVSYEIVDENIINKQHQRPLKSASKVPRRQTEVDAKSLSKMTSSETVKCENDLSRLDHQRDRQKTASSSPTPGTGGPLSDKSGGSWNRLQRKEMKKSRLLVPLRIALKSKKHHNKMLFS